MLDWDGVFLDLDEPIYHSYLPTDALPKGFVEDWCPDLSSVEAFQQGIEPFFAPLANTQPRTYVELTKSGNQLYLVKSVTPGFSDPTSEVVVYFWAVQLAHCVITAPIQLQGWQQHVDEWQHCIPSCLHGYYHHFNGLNIPESIGPSLECIDLISDNTNWYDINQLFSTSAKSRAQKKALQADFGGHDLRVIQQTRAGDVLFIDKNTADQQIYHTTYDDLSAFTPLSTPCDTIDALSVQMIRNVST